VVFQPSLVTSTAQTLLDELAELDPAGAAWIGEQLGTSDDPQHLRVAFARAARKLAQLRSLELGRTALVLAALEHADDPALVERLYRSGELGEQQSVLRMLPRLPQPQRFTMLAIEACRSNARPVFAAIASDNPFPAAWFPDPAFAQLVLKAVFVGVPVASIVGLGARATAALREMALGYASERRAAGRSVPSDIDVILAVCPPMGAPT
jgi:hypothetical protein